MTDNDNVASGVLIARRKAKNLLTLFSLRSILKSVSVFSNTIQKGKTCYSEEQVISMLEFFIDNIFISFEGALFQQDVGIPMGTNCAPLLADLFYTHMSPSFFKSL